MRRLNFQLKQLCKTHRDGSYGTQVQRERVLALIANQLHELGYRQLSATSLKPKHVEALVQAWLNSGLGVGTMKNRMATIRWWAGKVNKRNVVARSNDQCGLARRQYATSANRATTLRAEQLERVTDPHVRMSLEMQRGFGLRREEALKICPDLADRGDTLWLKPSWTKGGRAREIPIRSETQNAVLDRAKQLAGKGSLIPAHKTCVRQLKLYEGQCIRAGLSRMHGLRHAYAQRRSEEITGFRAPLAGRPTRPALSIEQRALDKKARAVVSRELGHRRIAITSVYLGT